MPECKGHNGCSCWGCVSEWTDLKNEGRLIATSGVTGKVPLLPHDLGGWTPSKRFQLERTNDTGEPELLIKRPDNVTTTEGAEDDGDSD